MSGIDSHIYLNTDVNLLVNNSRYYISTNKGDELNLPEPEMYGMLHVFKAWDIVAQFIVTTKHVYYRCWISYLNTPSFKIIA